MPGPKPHTAYIQPGENATRLQRWVDEGQSLLPELLALDADDLGADFHRIVADAHLVNRCLDHQLQQTTIVSRPNPADGAGDAHGG